ncbi:hypothetical protein BS47DRAFT_1368319 [Hydnum rufescens UP504]|uniref:Uncharacterized protein n=1 Tax=Hydnum rufescens UP504 TaxID=1448309 RepID=A0A9P6AG38_9AGAM|nr:hypothetical protein BS47DRAFT_1368319 [Hydnum rufescens UP504]
MVFIIYPYGVGTVPNWVLFRARKVLALNSSDRTQHRGARSKQNGATHPPGQVCGTIRFFPFVKPRSDECTDKTPAKYGPVHSHPDPEPARQPTKYRTTHPLRRMCGNNWSLPSVTTHPMSTWTSPQYPQPPKPGVPAPHNDDQQTFLPSVCGNIRFLPSVKTHLMNKHTDEPPICATTQAAPRNYNRRMSLPYVKTHLTNEHMDEPPIRAATQAAPRNDDRWNCVPHTRQSGCVVNIRSIPYMKTHPTRTRTSPPTPQALSARPRTRRSAKSHTTPAAAGVVLYNASNK